MTNSISGKTKICGLIGDPVEHSVSPALQNAAFRKLGLDYIYVPFPVKGEGLGKAIDGMRALNIRGLNVTIPHKVSVMHYLDRIDPLAQQIGAVNTIVNDNGVLTGHNTDAAGFLQALRDGGANPEGKKVALLGAGGVARAIAFVLAENGARLTILNRKIEFGWAQDLAQRISDSFKLEAKALVLDEKNLKEALDEAGILVNATSVGMSPNVESTPVPAQYLKPGLAVFDVVYNPLKTRLLREAATAGARTIGGINMLVWQGAVAFEKWTGEKAPVATMKRAAMRAMEQP